MASECFHSIEKGTTLRYRAEIDGLRAVAVIPVMFFHAGFKTFSGGFVGVDVFFVISGYLITTIILSEMNEGKFSIVNFYERRARRILPALFVVLFACLPFAWLWLLPEELKHFSQSLIAVSVFASNILFWKTSGYFAMDSELKPLLHTWSLAVEEQYYLFFPLFLMLAWRFGQRWILVLLTLVAIVSLAAAQWGSVNKPLIAFYLLPTRSWELMIGAFVAFYFLHNGKSNINTLASQIGSAIGLMLLTYAIFAFDKKTPFPSAYTLVPTVGTALIILCASQRTWVGKVLANKLFVGVGLISYSAYLWHQPLFAFAKQRSFDAPSKILLGGLIAAALLLAYFSWRFVETPFRSKERFKRKQIFAYGAVFSAFFILLGSVGHFNKGFLKLKTRDSLYPVLETVTSSPKRDDCHTGGADYLKPKDACEYQTGSLNWATFGDSHTVELAYALAEKLKPLDIKLKHFSFSACPPTYGRTIDELKHCSKWTNEAVEYIGDNKDIKNVLVSYRIHAALFGGHEHVYPAFPDDLSETERDMRWNSYVGVLRYFVSRGKHVVLILQAPELPKPVDKLLYSAADPLDEVVGVKREWWNERIHYVMNRLNQIPREVKVIDLTKLFCDDTSCYAAKGGSAYYFDDNHLSVAGARIVIEEVLKTPADNIHMAHSKS